MRCVYMLELASVGYFLWANVSLRRSHFVASHTYRPGRRSVDPGNYSRTSLRAFFKRCGFAAQVRERFAGEMKRARDQNRIWLCACKHQCIANV